MTNQLSNQTSPYLLQHANNPVNWYPWGIEALERARQEDKPIFLSIGYAACHWCHVMEKESFEDENIAAFLNENFISIKVDREERPDLDHIYMTAVQLLTGSGGWPMSVFLSPDLKPFYGGTYFPPRRSHGLPAFGEILRTINHLWRNERENLLRVSQKLQERLLDEATWQPAASDPFDTHSLTQAVANLENHYDWNAGGWGPAPKFPQPMAIEFLLRQAQRGDKSALKLVTHALQAMQRGGMYDVVGGGFHRYSTDAQWLVPHFEKMLYDNALLARVYLHAWLITGDLSFRQTAEHTLNFVLREMTDPLGGFYSSLDADSEGQEGKFYVWSQAELKALLPDEKKQQILLAVYSISDHGNFEGKIIFQQSQSSYLLADELGISESELREELAKIHITLLKARSARIRPLTDDKVLTAWNAWMLQTFAEAGRYLKRTDYLSAAQKNAHFLLTHLQQEGRLLRSWRHGKANLAAYLEDYAALIIALLELFQSDSDPRWYQSARELFTRMNAEFSDPLGGYFDTDIREIELLVRPKALQDNATPSGNALAMFASLLISQYENLGELSQQVEKVVSSVSYPAVRYPLAFSEWLKSIDYLVGPQTQVALLFPAGSSVANFNETLWSRFRPRLISAISPYPPPQIFPELVKFRSLVQQLPTAYICFGQTCLVPTNDPAEFTRQLNAENSIISD